MSVQDLPPLDGSALFDPWRIRYRDELMNGGPRRTPRRPTRSEVLLWEELQRAPREWVTEFPTRYGYTLDFYCADVRLAVEVDGPSHWGKLKADSDAWRDEVHGRMGIRTRRFSASDVERNAAEVAREIEAFAVTRAGLLAADPEVVELAVAAALVEGPAVDALAGDERLVAFPPEPPGWSAYLPACRTVLPAAARRRPLRGTLVR